MFTRSQIADRPSGEYHEFTDLENSKQISRFGREQDME